ncbi:15-hydroxyprostaglandin dehydrogenase [NAD(+)]-like isoform X2 [Liolophura sinensis]|uniref:15-hydroxyprostaglandin dehydrogenase [NAD(+)]-like isoform X2 n=1 Tax=Liolophura sinensis TaxID=3198878 RepID=UPI003159205C
MLVEGKVALITGGARGIGRAIAEELLRHGAKVCLVDVLKNELSQTESELKKEFGEDSVITSIADITKEEQFTVSFEQSVSKFGKIDILVNNASIQKEGLWETMLSINLGGTIRGTLLAMKFMNPETGGVVVNMSSISVEQRSDRQEDSVSVSMSTIHRYGDVEGHGSRQVLGCGRFLFCRQGALDDGV